MLLKKNFFFFLFFPFAVFGQFVDKTDTRYKAYFYESGNISSEGFLENDKPNNYWITYYPNQLRKSEGNRLSFELDGVWKFYDKKGNIETSITYKNGLKNGVYTFFNDSCLIVAEESYKDDVKEGIAYQYFPDTSLKKRIKKSIPYEQNKKNGIAYEFAWDGRIITITTYKNDFLVSKEVINRKDKKGKQDIWKKFYSNKRTREEARYKNDLLNGYFKLYNKKGKLESAVLYINGVEQSQEKNIADFDINADYYENGTVKSTILYNKAGKKDGVANYYNKDGTVRASEIFRNGYLLKKGIIDKEGLYQGTWEFYYLNDTLKSKGEYKNGKKYGKWKYFFSNGKLEQEGFYDKNGEYTGEWKWYYENGNILRREDYRKGVEEGFMEEYSISGALISKGEYIEGEKDGEWFYELNDHKENGKYRYGEKDGYWEYKHANGNLAFEGNYLEGIPDGKHKYYNKEGVLIKEESFSYGKKDGKWKWYDNSGFEIMNIDYKDGNEIRINGQKVKFTKK